MLSDQDLYLFNEGTHLELHERMGARLTSVGGRDGVRFSVWAPNAESVHVIGDFNCWDRTTHPMRARGSSGIWELFVEGVECGSLYKYYIASPGHGFAAEKADPYACGTEAPPRQASRVVSLDYEWGDSEWMARRGKLNGCGAPISVYEMHTGSWRMPSGTSDRLMNYRELAGPLADHLEAAGFTHVELMPVMEHPFYGSWGYQVTSYFAPGSRQGSAQDFMYLVDHLHQRGFGVILDWVPSHFPADPHGLALFDGTHLYEHADPRQGFHPDWKSCVFNYGRNEVRSFLMSNALFWLDKYHADGLRVDAVASMLYLDYSRADGEWIPNQYGGRENLEAVSFLRALNSAIYARFPDTITIAEESTSWPMVSRPVYLGGLGFGFKWDMGWMHDSLRYFSRDPVFRSYHQNELTFRCLYAFSENFVLALSHDEVVHGKGSLLGRMPGDEWQKIANLRLLFGWMFAQPGKKLLFMGGEFGQIREWSHERELDWELLDRPLHSGVMAWVRDLNAAYRSAAALHAREHDPAAFEWIDCNDRDQCVLSFVRGGRDVGRVLCVFNFTPVPRSGYRVGVPAPGVWREILNSDAKCYGGSGIGNMGGVRAAERPFHGRPWSLELTLPPLAVVFLQADPERRAG